MDQLKCILQRQEQRILKVKEKKHNWFTKTGEKIKLEPLRAEKKRVEGKIGTKKNGNRQW